MVSKRRVRNRSTHPPPILKHRAKAVDACKKIQSAKALQFIPHPLEADEEVAGTGH